MTIDALGAQEFYVDAITVELNTSLAIAQPDAGNQRGVPVVDVKGNAQPAANMDAVIAITQPVTIRLYTIDDLITAQNNGADPGAGLPVTNDANFELGIDLSQAAPAITMGLKSLFFGSTEIKELEALMMFPPVRTALNVGALSTFLETVGLDMVARGGVSLFLALQRHFGQIGD